MLCEVIPSVPIYDEAPVVGGEPRRWPSDRDDSGGIIMAARGVVLGSSNCRAAARYEFIMWFLYLEGILKKCLEDNQQD